MTNSEFSDSLDTLLNSYNIQAGFGEGANKQGGITLDEYEKSVILTQAQDNIVKSYFDRTLNQQGQGFDDSIRRQVDFSSLIHIQKYVLTEEARQGEHYDDRGLTVNLEDTNDYQNKLKILFILNERLEVGRGVDKKIYVVVPINYREYDREMSKAYAQPLKKQVWRLFSNAGTGYDIKSEIIPIYGTINTKDRVSYYRCVTVGQDEDAHQEWEEESELSGTLKGTIYSTDELPEASDVELGDEYKLITSTIDDRLVYTIRYVKRPTPIILRKLPDGLTIDGYTGDKEYTGVASKTGMSCSLNPILHQDILDEAFRLAVTTRGGGTAQQQRSSDNKD